MEYIPVAMIRHHLNDLPRFPLPEGYRIRLYQPGDEKHWAAVESAAGEFDTPETALAHFLSEFGSRLNDMEQRCCLLQTEAGQVIGTATAWYDDDQPPWNEIRPPGWQGDGRLHWVAIHPDFQRRGLGKPLVAAAMHRLAQFHQRAFLTTQTTSWIAVKIYLDFGFQPFLFSSDCRRAWKLIATVSGHPALAAFRDGA